MFTLIGIYELVNKCFLSSSSVPSTVAPVSGTEGPLELDLRGRGAVMRSLQRGVSTLRKTHRITA